MTALHAASQMNRLDVLKWMVNLSDLLWNIHNTLNPLQVEDQAVDPNLRDGDGATPLHFAASRGKPAFLYQELLKSPIYIFSGHLSVVKWLLNHGAKLSLDKYGKSPINDAAENQQTECLNILVQHSSDYISSSHNKQRHSTTKPENYSLNHSSFLSKCSTASSDSEPFYLHPPNSRQLKVRKANE